MTKGERAAAKAAYNGPKYEVPTNDPGRPCKSCGVNIYFVKTESGKWMPIEYDGIPHWGFCSEPEKYSRRPIVEKET